LAPLVPPPEGSGKVLFGDGSHNPLPALLEGGGCQSELEIAKSLVVLDLVNTVSVSS